MNDRIIPYFNFYSTDFKALKDKLTKDDLWDIVDAMCDLCIYGETDYKPENNYQERYFNKIVSNFDKSKARYLASVENGKKGGRKPKNNPQVNPQVNPQGKANKTKQNNTILIQDYTNISNKLAKIIEKNKNIKTRPSGWYNDVRLLVEQDCVSVERINIALEWYSKNIGVKYTPVIESGKSLREKFIKLESAIEREEPKQKKPWELT